MKRKFRLLNLLSMMSCITLFFFNNIFSQNRQVILHRNYPLSELKKILISRQDWHPFPTSQERDSWKALPEEVRQGLILREEKYLNYQWPALPASLFLDFTRTSNRENFQKPRSVQREALCGLVLAECSEGKGRFIDDIVNGIWTICEESYWGVPAHLSLQAQGLGLPDVTEPTVDLFSSETGSLLAWTSYLLGLELDRISPLIHQRIQLELEKRILTPCLERDDFWWMGFRPGVIVNNWNPWINSNWLTVVLLNEKYDTKRLMDGLPMIIDVGVETYTRKTFSAQRYEIWTMQSAYHNLPTIDGVMQKNGCQFAAREVQYTADDSFAQLRLDIADAYPSEAGISR